MKKVILSLAVVATLISCSSDDDNPTVSPSNYSFSRNGTSTVSYGGQTTRIQMGEELLDALKVPTETLASLTGKFAHSEGDADFTDANLNASDKSIRSKTAASSDFFSANSTGAAVIKEQFDSWISAQVDEVFPSWSVDASAGVAGQIQQAGGGSVRYINAKGLEYNQAINKGLIGALVADQILNNYLSTAVLDEASNRTDNDNETLDGDNNYTTMEHKWDEAFGYLYALEPDATSPVLNNDSFLNEYLSRVNDDADFAGIADDIYNAFTTGRAAIVNKDYTTRDNQAEIIKEKISEVIAVRGIYYLQQGKNSLSVDDASAFHALSEAVGFIYSLQFTRQPNSTEPYLSATEVDTILNALQSGNGFWDVTEATLEEISETIAAKFNFTVLQAAS
ncbi:DUF4856 domain-containing protein [Polaribacter sp. R2A056_3_33]|jgi:hypothetical protein|uniref:DUF4856 domain-containing protein n=1 Tax=unclassified Polaribacter TaxID=196858 RepID=UPI001C4FACC2|nr:MULTISPECIES: DUF4856 domain-containing protein [unclassified Polaribacter]QXP62333.1 DUF4856 domain-containing protein [Polaribacter sp. HaHaR_3_91]QXP70259.1 DUF4856 domain-containing protein [Polaribacter sp. R2A056_3_33]